MEQPFAEDSINPNMPLTNSINVNVSRINLLRVLGGVVALVVVAFYIGSTLKTSSGTNFPVVTTITTSSTPTVTSSVLVPTASPVHVQTSLFSGTLQKLTTDLALFYQNSDEKLNNVIPKGTYYSAGTFLTGKYKGYTRILALKQYYSGAADGSRV